MSKWNSLNSTRALEFFKGRGFLFPTAQIYHGIKGSVDLGPLTVQIKRNIEKYWWQCIVDTNSEIHGFQSPILTPASVLKASGHVDQFADLMLSDNLTGARFRVDKAARLLTTEIRRGERLHKAIPIRAPSKSIASNWEKQLSRILPAGSWIERRDTTVYVFVQKIIEPPSTDTASSKSVGSIVLQPAPVVDLANTLERSFNNPDLEIAYFGHANPDNNSPFLSPPVPFNLLFKTFVDTFDPIDQIVSTATSIWQQNSSMESAQTHNKILGEINSALDSKTVYLRPETAQGVYTAFPILVKSLHLIPPFGIAQAELQYFVPPWQALQAYSKWKHRRLAWWKYLANDADCFRAREHEKSELAHYARACTDIEYTYPWGWGELEGIANRGSYDLDCHGKASGVSMAVYDQTIPSLSSTSAHDEDTPMPKYVPHVIESAAGLSRAVIALLLDAYTEIPVKSSNLQTPASRVVLKLHPRIAPCTIQIFPIVGNNERLVKLANQVHHLIQYGERRDLKQIMPSSKDVDQEEAQLASQWQSDIGSRVGQDAGSGLGWTSLVETRGSVGKRYQRADEIGVPICITIDELTCADDTVTVRHRDTTKQVRVQIDQLVAHLRHMLQEF